MYNYATYTIDKEALELLNMHEDLKMKGVKHVRWMNGRDECMRTSPFPA